MIALYWQLGWNPGPTKCGALPLYSCHCGLSLHSAIKHASPVLTLAVCCALLML